MGAWGLSPFDSDDFGDEFDRFTRDISSKVFEQLQRRLANATRQVRARPNEAWATIGIAIWAVVSGALRDTAKIDTVKAACNDLLDELSEDIGWFDSWRGGGFRSMWQNVRDVVQGLGDEPPEVPSILSEGLKGMSQRRRTRKRS